ncbi:MAG: hypothetical protein RLZZ292_2838 [Bacteroidota bacterium]|jgi:RNA polymerase sigma-70 factor (ECF subfamily)
MENQLLQSIINRCRQQERVAQRQLYDDFYRYVLGICARYARSNEEAREMCNDVFLKVFARLSLYSAALSFKGWLRRIAVNTAIDYFRRQQHVPNNLDISYAQSVETPSSVLAELSANELLELVRQLPPSYKMVFNLYVVEGFSHPEIAQELNINEGTSRSNLAKARLKLQTLIAEQDKNYSSNSTQYTNIKL